MSNSRVCNNCKCPCLLVSIGCILKQLNPFVDTTPVDRIRSAVDEATLRYLRPLISEDCFTEICNALDKSELPTGDDNYEELPSHFKQFIDEFATPLLSDAATALYIDSYGDDRLGVEFETTEEKMSYVQRRYAGASAGKQRLKLWLEDESIALLFTCRPKTEEKSKCAERDTLGVSSDFGDFAASTNYPSGL